ncbi:MAG TPA: hypothetical protein VGE74_09695 [Gemmata sp.]
MSESDLLKLFDLDGAETPTAPPIGITESGGKKAKPKAEPPAAQTVIDVDEWGLRKGRDLVTAHPRIRAACREDEFAAADFHAVAFEPDPQFTPKCKDATREKFIRQLLETPDAHALRTATVLDDTASEIAATAFAEQYAVLLKEHEKRPKPKGGTRPGSTDAESRADGPDDITVMRAVARGLDEAYREVEDFKDMTGAMGMGPGSPGGKPDPATTAALFKRVRTDPQLRRICELAGRFRLVAQSKQRTKAAHGFDDIVGIEPTGELSRLLPIELAKLAVPELELDMLRRLAERQTLGREYQSTEPVAKGPIIVCVDESGSMSGERVATAKALALAMAWVARQQNRWVGLVAYSGDSGERLLALPPGRWNESALCDWLERFIGGGSYIDVPVREMPRMYRQIGAPEGKTDVLFITDAICSIPPDVRERFAAWKAEAKARLITLVIGARGESLETSSLAAISDESHAVPALSADDAAVGRVLSV